MTEQYLYDKLDAEDSAKQKLTARIFGEKIDIKGYRKRTLKELQETINKLHTIGFSENTLEQQKFLQTKNYSLPFIPKIFSAIHYEADELEKNNLPETPQLKEKRKTLRNYETELNINIQQWILKLQRY